MEDNSLVTTIDAVANLPLPNIQNENWMRESNHLSPDAFNNILQKFTIDDYKAIFLLCMDYISAHEILTFKKEKSYFEERFYNLYYDKLNEHILVELLGTLKIYEHLKSMNTCSHIYKNRENDFTEISYVWKVIYSLCEEITDDNLQSLKQYLPENIKDQILSAEEWFMYALDLKMFTETDLSYLKRVFNDNAVCLNIINKFKVKPKEYGVKTPTILNPCGLAVIFNFQTFDKASKLKPRDGSNVDAEALNRLWTTYGFKTTIIEDLNHLDFSKEMERYSLMDHKCYDAFVCCILSHGHTNTVFTSDGRSISIPSIINTFCEKCKSLNEKPKLFFIQACQGTKIHQGAGKQYYPELQNYVKPSSHLEIKSLQFEETVSPSHEDVLTVTSTVPGYVSFRHCVTGSWFIQTLCQVLDSGSDHVSIQDIIPVLTDRVYKLRYESGSFKNANQIVPTFSTLRKKLILKKLKSS